ncbi:MAG: RNA polymerase sigma factor [Opitutales bacterium]
MSRPAPEMPPEFEALVAEYYQSLYRFGFSLAKNEADASDLVQDTFLIWARKGSGLRDQSKVKSWLFTTLYREFLRLRRRSVRQADLDPEEFDRELPAVESDTVNQLEAQDALAALQEVDDIYREPLALFYLDDLSYKEIAATLDIPIGTVMSRLSRGKAQLKRFLERKV